MDEELVLRELHEHFGKSLSDKQKEVLIGSLKLENALEFVKLPNQEKKYLLEQINTFEAVEVVPALFALYSCHSSIVDLLSFAFNAHLECVEQGDAVFFATRKKLDIFTVLLEHLLNSSLFDGFVEDVFKEKMDDFLKGKDLSVYEFVNRVLNHFIENAVPLPQSLLYVCVTLTKSRVLHKNKDSQICACLLFGTMIPNTFKTARKYHIDPDIPIFAAAKSVMVGLVIESFPFKKKRSLSDPKKLIGRDSRTLHSRSPKISLPSSGSGSSEHTPVKSRARTLEKGETDSGEEGSPIPSQRRKDSGKGFVSPRKNRLMLSEQQKAQSQENVTRPAPQEEEVIRKSVSCEDLAIKPPMKPPKKALPPTPPSGSEEEEEEEDNGNGDVEGSGDEASQVPDINDPKAYKEFMKKKYERENQRTEERLRNKKNEKVDKLAEVMLNDMFSTPRNSELDAINESELDDVVSKLNLK